MFPSEKVYAYPERKEAVKKETKQQQYNDPLMSWPIRGLAYSNELGAAISEVAPKLGTLLWFPAMLYFGADIYDKYKNEKTCSVIESDDAYAIIKIAEPIDINA